MIDLKAWRTGHGMTPHQAAGALGIGDSTVRAIEAGTRKMTVTLSLACHGWDATHCDEPVADASLEARLTAIEQRLLPDADRAFVLRWHAAWLARQPLPAATISKAIKAWQADDDMSEEDLEAAKARALASLPPEDEIQRQIRQGMLEQREREKLERAKKQQAEEMATIARRAARSVLPD